MSNPVIRAKKLTDIMDEVQRKDTQRRLLTRIQRQDDRHWYAT